MVQVVLDKVVRRVGGRHRVGRGLKEGSEEGESLLFRVYQLIQRVSNHVEYGQLYVRKLLGSYNKCSMKELHTPLRRAIDCGRRTGTV